MLRCRRMSMGRPSLHPSGRVLVTVDRIQHVDAAITALRSRDEPAGHVTIVGVPQDVPLMVNMFSACNPGIHAGMMAPLAAGYVDDAVAAVGALRVRLPDEIGICHRVARSWRAPLLAHLFRDFDERDMLLFARPRGRADRRFAMPT